TTRTASVDDFGHITAITDPIGSSPADTTTTTTTTFGYDVMGRLNQITQPAGDSVAWLPTTVTFSQVNATEYGLQPGHWKQVECTGPNACASAGAVKVTYFDGQWQPVLSRAYDAANPAATQRFSSKAFDFAGRTTFASYPVGNVVTWSDPLTGVHSAYDGLGRPTASTQDSELGPLTTSYAYLPGFITQVTNPRGYVTGTAYQAFDGPDTSHPSAIVSPEGVTTTLARDVFGKPTAITRSGTWNGSSISATRSYVYDTHQRLCKRIEPETGSSYVGYDAANNPVWTASGIADASLSCNPSVVPVASQTTRTFDARNRVLTVNVPNSTDDLAYAYDNDGALQTLSNGSGASAIVWNYAYDLRRLPTTETLTLDGRTRAIGHAYDAYGHESVLTYPDGLAIATAPNALGQPTQ
ncbi:MAG: RHS repeat protein, partial [Proteobacteria bacterium]|nr:RHS repeat protein [Pseudomonadota bacterium]